MHCSKLTLLYFPTCDTSFLPTNPIATDWGNGYGIMGQLDPVLHHRAIAEPNIAVASPCQADRALRYSGKQGDGNSAVQYSEDV